MGNYIKTLILSTMVLVIGNSSNYCYSIGVNNNGNIIQHGDFLQENYNLEDQFRHQLNNLGNLLENIIHNHQNMTQTQDRVLNFFSMRNFYYRYYICGVFSGMGWDSEQQFNINIVNNEIPGLILPNMLNQYNNITFNQLSHYVATKIYTLMINNINRIVNIINAWNGQDINELIYQIIDATSHDYYRMDNIIKSFLDFCDNHSHQIGQNVVAEIKHKIELRHHMLEVDKTYMHIKFYNQVEEIQQIINNNDDLINFDLRSKCLDAILKLNNELITRQNLQNDVNLNFQDEADLIYRFAYICCNSMTNMFDKNFIKSNIEDYPEAYDITDDEKNAVVFAVGQLENNITIHVARMLIYMKNRMLQNNLTSQQLGTFIRTCVSNCINDVQDALNNVVLQLTNKNNILHKLDIKEHSDENKFTNKAVDSINKNNEHLNELKQQYGL